MFRSVCRGCHGGCGALLTVRNGRLIEVAPDPDAAPNYGQFCEKGIATPEMMYSPQRLTTPLKRDGARGSNRWTELDWETALDEIAKQLDGIRTESGPEAIALGQGTGRHHYLHVVRFANLLGTPNWYEPGLANCFIPRITVSNFTYGGLVVGDYYGEVNPKTILFWGSNPFISGPDGELPFPVRRALSKGSFGIAVDPRKSESAKRSGLWLPIRPGTDDAMALAMAHVIINEGYYDRAFVERWTVGFSELKQHVADCTPQWAAAITEVAPELIVEAARRYALDKPSVLEWGVGLEQNPNSLQTVRAVAILRGLTGNIDIPGGDILGMNILRAYPVHKDKLPAGMIRKRIGADQFKLLGGFRAFMPSAHIPGLFKAMRTGDPYRIRALLLFGGNPMLTVCDTHDVHESLQRLDLLVATDMFMTPTAALADYVLPASLWPEVNQIVELPYVVENMVAAQQRVATTGLCRQDEEILDDLARRLDLPCSDETLEDVLNYRLEPLGINFDDLTKRRAVYPPHVYHKYEQRGFRTPSRKVELYCRSLARLGYSPLPRYEEPAESTVSRPDLAKTFPYNLITGSRRMPFFHSDNRQIHYLRKKHPDPIADLHPTTALRHEIRNGDWIYVRSPRGQIKMKARVKDTIKNDVVSIDHGWWFPERPGPDFGVWESNANVLTSSGPPYDPAFGSQQHRALLCSVEKIRDAAEIPVSYAGQFKRGT